MSASTLAIDKRLTTIGISVSYGSHVILGAIDFGDLGGEPNEIDATTLLDEQTVNVLGLQQQEKFNVNYIYNDDDYSALKTAENAKTSATLTIDLGANGTFTNTATVSTYVTGAAVGEVIKAVASFGLGGKWTYTPHTP